LGRQPLGAILHSSNEPGELSQWLWHDDSTINIVVIIIIIIIITGRPVRSAAMLVLFFLSGPTMGFSPCRGDTSDKREIWHGGADRRWF